MKTHRVLFRITDIDDGLVTLVCPSWGERPIELVKRLLPKEIAIKMKVGDYMLGHADLDAAEPQSVIASIESLEESPDGGLTIGCLETDDLEEMRSLMAEGKVEEAKAVMQRMIGRQKLSQSITSMGQTLVRDLKARCDEIDGVDTDSISGEDNGLRPHP